MVHYKPFRGRKAKTDTDRRNTYWMLGFYNKTAYELRVILEEYGYQYPSSATKAVLMEAVGRCQRGLLCYKNCSITELRAFCDARSLTVPSNSTTVSRLSRVLEIADDDATFPRFLDLPVELRVKIYELHFLDYAKMQTRHRQPPLTLVPQIRAEALPLFYGCVTFTWHLTPWSSPPNIGHHFHVSSRPLLKMPAANLAQVRNFHLHWIAAPGPTDGTGRRSADLHACVSESNNAKKKFSFTRTNDGVDTREIEAVIRDILQSMGFGESTWKLQLTELHAIEEKVNGILRASP